jgi:hypothetical protein
MSRDHAEVARLNGLLGELREKLAAGGLTHQDQRELRMVLYGLYVLVRLHLQKEEEEEEEDAYLPLLDLRLTPEQATGDVRDDGDGCSRSQAPCRLRLTERPQPSSCAAD